MITDKEKFQQLEEKSKKVIEGAIQINTKIETAQESYKKLSEIALSKYNTDNIEELEQLLSKYEKENAEQIANYEKAVLDLEKEVNEKMQAIKNIQQAANS